MDKNRINIDELLRQRLGNAEEPMRSGAWLNMRELLDKEMPERTAPPVAAGTNWRRMFAYSAGVVILLVALSVGGYEMLDSFNSGTGIAENTNSTPRKPSATSGLAGSAINALPETKQTEEDITTQEPVAAEQSVATSTVSNTNNTTHNNNYNTNTTVNSDKVNNLPTVANNTTANKVASTNTTAPAVAAANTQEPATKQATSSSQVIDNITNTANKPAPANATGNSNNNNNVAAKNSKQQAAPEMMSTGNAQTTDVNISNEVAKKNFKEEEIPYRKIERKERMEDGVAKMDTIYNGEDVLTVRKPIDNTPATPAKNNSDELASGSNINPAAAANTGQKEVKEEEVVLKKLGDNRVSRKKMKNYNPNRFEEMVKNAKYRFGSIKLYPGIVGGANAAFNGNYGGHLGLALNTSVGERWSILTEVKFAYRTNGSGENLQDDYIDNVRTSTVNGQTLTRYDSVEHYYNFTNYAAIEAPVLFNYTHKRFSYLAGVNFKYNFGISSLQEVEITHASESPSISTNNGPFEGDKKILVSDFSSNFNIGPMIGFGYNATPAVRLDMRATVPVWTNASTYGEKEIARQVFARPQVQFNISYRFNRNKFKPYKRNQ